MKELLLACETLKDELEKALDNIPNKYDLKWMSSELHMFPDDLRTALQKEIDNNKEYENILFAYGNCGNGLVGLKATTANLIIPKTADCISMLLHNYDQLSEIRKNTYFLTKAWIESTKGIMEEFNYTVDKYGEKKALRIMTAMFRHYKHLMLIDTGAYNLKPYEKASEELANKLSLEMIIEKGDIHFLEKLLLRQWDEDFCIIKKGEEVLIDHFGDNIINEDENININR